jgi:hypothetical protein
MSLFDSILVYLKHMDHHSFVDSSYHVSSPYRFSAVLSKLSSKSWAWPCSWSSNRKVRKKRGSNRSLAFFQGRDKVAGVGHDKLEGMTSVLESGENPQISQYNSRSKRLLADSFL